ncbi:MAG: type II secretion system F family protein [Candidatus Liptonbacteria bacterium]
MPNFTYEASDKSGALRRGRYEAMDKQAVIEYLERHELIPITVLGDNEVVARSRGLKTTFFETVSATDRIVMVRNLSATIKAGLNILEGLDVLIKDSTKEIVRRILTEAKLRLQDGQPLSATFAAYKKQFPPVCVGLVRAGEASGRLDTTLDELAQHLSKEYGLVRKVRSALAYPVMLLISSIAVVTVLLIFVLPRLAKSFKAAGAELPWTTQIIFKLSDILTWSPILDLAIVALLAWFFIYFRRTAAGRRFFMEVMLRIPVARELVKKVALVRFTRTLGSLIQSGMVITEALALSAEAVGNVHYEEAILTVLKKIKDGVPLSRTLAEYPRLFPQLLLSMIAVGERTGTLEHVLKTFSEFYDEEVDNTLKDLTTFIEPLMLLFMGLIIGSIAFSVLLPIYQLVGKYL